MSIHRRHFMQMLAGLGLAAPMQRGFAVSPPTGVLSADHAMAERPTKQVIFPDGRKVPPIGMGSWHLGQGRHADKEEITALQLGLDLGLSLIDTAEMYGDGQSEKLIGRAIEGRRDQVFLVSKAYPWHANRLMIERACNESLSRLATDHLDLYLLHWRFGSLLGEAVESFERLKSAGKILSWGVSNFDTDDMQELFEIGAGNHCATDQVFYNLGSRGTEFALQPWCGQHGLPVMAYSPLGGSGSHLLQHPLLAQIARKHASSSAAVALAWAIRGGQVIAIPESGTPAHIRENASALSLNLDDEDIEALDADFPAPTHPVPLETR